MVAPPVPAGIAALDRHAHTDNDTKGNCYFKLHIAGRRDPVTKTSELAARAAGSADSGLATKATNSANPGPSGRGTRGAGQERVADRLLRSTAARSYDPEL